MSTEDHVPAPAGLTPEAHKKMHEEFRYARAIVRKFLEASPHDDNPHRNAILDADPFTVWVACLFKEHGERVVKRSLLPNELDVDGIVDAKGVKFIGKATRQANGTYRCLADVGGALCIVEVRCSATRGDATCPMFVNLSPDTKCGKPVARTWQSISMCEDCFRACERQEAKEGRGSR